MTDDEFRLIKRRLRILIGIDLNSYKSPQLRRRLDGYLHRAHASSWTELLHTLANDPQALRRLRDYLTINVSNFFRDFKKWEELRDLVLPQIMHRGRPIQVWSAACSHGAEAYSLAMLLQDYPAVIRYRILGTDLDRTSLESARAGGPYTSGDIKEVPPGLLANYFQRDAQGYWVKPALRTRISFEEQDLLRPTAVAQFDLIVCRNVLIYFTETAKTQVIHGLVRALIPGGMLFIGATENISKSREMSLERIGVSFYRRIDPGSQPK